MSSFEVWVESQLIYSKLSTGGFPDTKEVVKIVKDVAAGADPREVLRSTEICLIM